MKTTDKITFKEWSALLPHKIKVAHFDKQFKGGYKLHTLCGLTENTRYNKEDLGIDERHLESVMEITFWLEDKRGLNNNIHIIKPLLRPLSDLTKEIEINGERFIPIDVLFPKKHHYGLDIMVFMQKIMSLGLELISYSMAQKLLEWNFDCFELIERGLAIDLNEI